MICNFGTIFQKNYFKTITNELHFYLISFLISFFPIILMFGLQLAIFTPYVKYLIVENLIIFTSVWQKLYCDFFLIISIK